MTTERIQSFIDIINRNIAMVLTTKDDDLYILHVTIHTDKEEENEIKTLKAEWNFSLVKGTLQEAKIKSECQNCDEYYVMFRPYLKDIEIAEGYATITFATPSVGIEYGCEDCESEAVEVMEGM